MLLVGLQLQWKSKDFSLDHIEISLVQDPLLSKGQRKHQGQGWGQGCLFLIEKTETLA